MAWLLAMAAWLLAVCFWMQERHQWGESAAKYQQQLRELQDRLQSVPNKPSASDSGEHHPKPTNAESSPRSARPTAGQLHPALKLSREQTPSRATPPDSLYKSSRPRTSDISAQAAYNQNWPLSRACAYFQPIHNQKRDMTKNTGILAACQSKPTKEATPKAMATPSNIVRRYTITKRINV